MSFFKTSDGQAPNKTGNAEMGGGDIEPIPGGTKLRAMIDEAKWDEYQGEKFIKLRWAVIDGEFKNRKVFQKVKVCNSDAGKRDKAINMLAAIDANCGGKVMTIESEPTDMDLLTNLSNKPMVIMVQVWEIEQDDGSKKRGNWVNAVESGKAKPKQQAPETDSAPEAESDAEGNQAIPF